MLAGSCGFTLEYENQREHSGKKQITEALGEVANTFQGSLLHPEDGRSACEYLYSRGIDLEMINRFRLGLVPDEEAMFALWKEKGGGLDPYKAGILRKFSGRISFPICDRMGRVVAFSCRKFSDGQEGPKYINGPNTEVFQKGSMLFGLDHSRGRIAKEGNVILVEGYTDVMRLVQEGMALSVATMGTALTENHCHELRKLGAKRAYVVFDGDDPGREASIKGGALLMGSGIESIHVSLPSGEDVDSYVRNCGVHAFTQLLEKGSEFLQAALKHKIAQHGETPMGKSRAAQEVVEMIDSWKDSVLKEESIKQLSDVLGVDKSGLRLSYNRHCGECRIFADRPVQAELEALAAMLRPETSSVDIDLMLHALEPVDFLNQDAARAFSIIQNADSKLVLNHSDRISLLEQAGMGALLASVNAVSSICNICELVRSLRIDNRFHRLKLLQKLLQTNLKNGDSATSVVAEIGQIETELELMI